MSRVRLRSEWHCVWEKWHLTIAPAQMWSLKQCLWKETDNLDQKGQIFPNALIQKILSQELKITCESFFLLRMINGAEDKIRGHICTNWSETKIYLSDEWACFRSYLIEDGGTEGSASARSSQAMSSSPLQGWPLIIFIFFFGQLYWKKLYALGCI